MLGDKDVNSSPSHNNDYENSCEAYLSRAAKACASGDEELGLHLFLTAYERGAKGAEAPSADAAFALRKAWVLALKLKERSLAEYIFEKLEPLMEPSELSVCAAQLQNLALEKLEEFGLSREDLQEMTDMISEDFLDLGVPHTLTVEHLSLPVRRHAKEQEAAGDVSPENDEPAEALDAAASAEGEADEAKSDDSETADTQRDDVDPGQSIGPDAKPAATLTEKKRSEDKLATEANESAVLSGIDAVSYKDVAGFARTIATMRDFGIGMQGDAQFQNLVSMLNHRHGLDRMPAADSFLFRSPAREDAHRFMTATLGELGLPAIRMHMEESLQGAPVLCVMAQADNHPKLGRNRTTFEGPGVLMLEDLDLWEAPMPSGDEDGFGAFVYASLSRGAREAVNLIRSAVENPDVYVLASASDAGPLDGFFFDLLEPLTIIDIDYPDDVERQDIWLQLAHDHPSLAGVPIMRLVELSKGMPRFDMYMAAREALEEAYKTGLVRRSYVPVTAGNLYEKLAAYQPLGSDEYRALEDAVISDFSQDLDGAIDDLLKG